MNDDKGYTENKKINSDTDQNMDALNYSLQKVAKGTVILFIGAIVGMLLAFAGRTLFARFFSPSEYGVFSLGFALFSMFTVLGTLGLTGGVTRQIAFYMGKKQIKKVQSIILWSLLFGVLAGIIISVIVFLCSDLIALRIFNVPNLSSSLKIFSIAIPFYIMVFIISSIFRGFKRVKEKVYFTDLIKNLLFPLFLIPVIVLGLSFEWGIVACTLSIVITSVAFVIYFIKKRPVNLQLSTKNSNILTGKNLLIFSLPLMFVAVMHQIMSWTDTMVLGYFKTSDIVGFYNAAHPLGSFVSTALASMLLIYTPIASELYSKGKNDEMRKSYAVLTKWLCAATLPLALIFALFPTVVLNFFFGQEYILAGTVLQILAIGFFINNLMGPNGATLIAMGKTKFLMGATFVAVCINVMLNFLLIPEYGINGAAIATVTTLVSINLIRSIKLYSISKIHSLEKNILKPIVLSVILVFVIYLIAKEFLTVTFWMLPILFVLFIILYVVSLLLTKSFDKEDIEMLLNIEKKTGVNLTKVKRLLKKFI